MDEEAKIHVLMASSLHLDNCGSENNIVGGQLGIHSVLCKIGNRC